MKKSPFFTVLSALVLSLLLATTVLADFTNGDFEAGSFSGWSKATFLNGLYPTRNPGGSDLSAVLGPFATQSQTDPYSNGNLKYPPYGQYVARVNSNLSYAGGGYPRNGNTLTQIATVEAGDVDPADSLVHVRFVYAGVMVNPLDHDADEKPYIYVVVKNHTKGDDILYEFQSYAGEPGKGWAEGPVFNNPDKWQYLDWQYVDIAESAGHPVDVGDEVFVEVTAVGCQFSGHPGYAYVDEFSFLKPAPIITVTDNPDPVDPSATLTYTFNYQAINAVDNPVIYIPIPSQTTFSSVSDPNCAYAAGAVTCNMPSLAAGASGAPFTLAVTVAPGAGGSTLHLQNYTIQGTSTKVNTGVTVDTTVNVPANLPPVIDQGETTVVVMDEDSQPRRFNLTLTATDPENDLLKWRIISGTTIGSAHINGLTGVVGYAPPYNYYGNQRFTAEVRDPYGGTDTIVVTIRVVMVDDPLLEEDSQYLSYNGWHRGKDPAASTETFLHSTDGKLLFQVPFGATEFMFYTKKGPDQGIVSVDIDGVLVKQADLYNATPIWGVPLKITLPVGAKKVTVIAANEKNPAASDSNVSYDGHQFSSFPYVNDDLKQAFWAKSAEPQATLGSYRATTRPGFVSLSFRGQQFAWNTYRGPYGGIANIYVDGVLVETVDLYRATPTWNMPVVVTGLAYGKHTILIEATNDKNPASLGNRVIMDSVDFE